MVKFWLFCLVHIIFLLQITYSIHSFFKFIDATEWKEREYFDYILVKGVYLVLFPCSYGIKLCLVWFYFWNIQSSLTNETHYQYPCLKEGVENYILFEGASWFIMPHTLRIFIEFHLSFINLKWNKKSLIVFCLWKPEGTFVDKVGMGYSHSRISLE